jgi:hypothetical protein
MWIDVGIGDLAGLSTGCADQKHVCTGFGIGGQSSTGAKDFVVRMGKYSQKGL